MRRKNIKTEEIKIGELSGTYTMTHKKNSLTDIYKMLDEQYDLTDNEWGQQFVDWLWHMLQYADEINEIVYSTDFEELHDEKQK